MTPSNRACIRFVIAFFAIYLDILVSKGLPIALPVCSLILLAILPGHREAMVRSLPTIFIVSFVALVAAVTTQAQPALEKVASSYIQSSVAIYIFFLILAAFKTFPKDASIKASAIIAAVFAVGILLEAVGLLTGASNWFGEAFYSNEAGYQFYGLSDYALVRDEQLAGFRRPTFFSPEPSIAVIGATVAFALFGCARQTFVAAAMSSFGLLALWATFQSPTPAFGLLVVVIDVVLRQRDKRLIVYLPAIAILAALPVLYLSAGRLERLASEPNAMATTSEGIRLILPFVNASASIEKGAVLGSGFGAVKDSNYLRDLNPAGADFFGTNVMAQLFFYFGILAPAVAYSLWRGMRPLVRYQNAPAYACLFFGLLSFSLGAIESIRVLGFLGLSMAFMASRKWVDSRHG